MSKPAKKPRKAATQKPAAWPVARKSAAPKSQDLDTPKSQWAPKPDHPHPVGRALAVAVKAFKGDKGALCEYIGIKRPNLSRTLRECREKEQGADVEITWPPIHAIKLSKVSGVSLHELAPDFYEPQHKTVRFKPSFDVDGKAQTTA